MEKGLVQTNRPYSGFIQTRRYAVRKTKKSSPFIYLNGPGRSMQSGWQHTKRTACQKSWIRVKLLLQSNTTSTDKVEKSTFPNRKAYFSCLWWCLSRRKHFFCITHPLSGTAVQWQKNQPNMALMSGESRLSVFVPRPVMVIKYKLNIVRAQWLNPGPISFKTAVLTTSLSGVH